MIDFCHIQDEAARETARAPAANLGRQAGRCRAQTEAGPARRAACPTPSTRPALSCPRDLAGGFGRPFLPKRTTASCFSNRTQGGQHITLPPSGVQRPSGSSASAGGSGRADRFGARCPGARHSRREGRKPRAGARGTCVGRQVSRALSAHAAGDPSCARLRVEQLPQACARRDRTRSVLVGALVQRLGDPSRTRGDGVAGRGRTNLARAHRVASRGTDRAA